MACVLGTVEDAIDYEWCELRYYVESLQDFSPTIDRHLLPILFDSLLDDLYSSTVRFVSQIKRHTHGLRNGHACIGNKNIQLAKVACNLVNGLLDLGRIRYF